MMLVLPTMSLDFDLIFTYWLRSYGSVLLLDPVEEGLQGVLHPSPLHLVAGGATSARWAHIVKEVCAAFVVVAQG